MKNDFQKGSFAAWYGEDLICLELRYFEDNFMPKDKNDVRFYNLRCATSNCFYVKKCLELL